MPPAPYSKVSGIGTCGLYGFGCAKSRTTVTHPSDPFYSSMRAVHTGFEAEIHCLPPVTVKRGRQATATQQLQKRDNSLYHRPLDTSMDTPNDAVHFTPMEDPVAAPTPDMDASTPASEIAPSLIAKDIDGDQPTERQGSDTGESAPPTPPPVPSAEREAALNESAAAPAATDSAGEESTADEETKEAPATSVTVEPAAAEDAATEDVEVEAKEVEECGEFCDVATHTVRQKRFPPRRVDGSSRLR